MIDHRVTAIRSDSQSTMFPTSIGAALVEGVPVDDVTLDETLSVIEAFVTEGRASGRTFQVATINVDFVVKATRDAALLSILQSADLCLADGMPVVWHAKLGGVALRERVAGADLVPKLVDRSRESGWRVLLFGSKDGVAETAAGVLLERFPGAHVRGIGGPIMSDVRTMDQLWIDQIESFKPDIVCVALGNPKQERWIAEHRSKLSASVLIGVGGTLDILVGDRRRAPAWMQRRGLEWLYRAAQEPKRLGVRYVRDAFAFAPHITRAAVERAASRRRHPSSLSATPDNRDNVLVVDLAGDALTRADITHLVGIARSADRTGGHLRLNGCSPGVARQFERLGIHKLFEYA